MKIIYSSKKILKQIIKHKGVIIKQKLYTVHFKNLNILGHLH